MHLCEAAMPEAHKSPATQCDAHSNTVIKTLLVVSDTGCTHVAQEVTKQIGRR